METKEIILPDGWVVKEVVDNKILIEEKEKELPTTWKECARIINDVELINIDSEVEGYAINDYGEYPTDVDRQILPVGLGKPMLALCQLLVCRDAWWKQLGWKPDWTSSDNKHCITNSANGIIKLAFISANEILAFPTTEVRDKFLESFRDLIEEAKELL